MQIKTSAVISVIIAVVGLTLFVTLLCVGKISEFNFFALCFLLIVVCLVIPELPRLRELALSHSGMRLTLNEFKAAKAELEELYGSIEHLRKAPLVLDKKRMESLGLDGDHIAVAGAAMRYPAGCIKRERERLARIFVRNKAPERIAEAILDATMDDLVFKWNGPETPLDQPPTSVEDRRKASEKTDAG